MNKNKLNKKLNKSIQNTKMKIALQIKKLKSAQINNKQKKIARETQMWYAKKKQ